jgi:hypothetical protein
MKYEVVHMNQEEHGEDTIDEFEKIVNRMIEEGWKPLGGITHAGYYYSQAMVKGREEDLLADVLKLIEASGFTGLKTEVKKDLPPLEQSLSRNEPIEKEPLKGAS